MFSWRHPSSASPPPLTTWRIVSLSSRDLLGGLRLLFVYYGWCKSHHHHQGFIAKFKNLNFGNGGVRWNCEW